MALIDIESDKVILFYLPSGRLVASKVSYINKGFSTEDEEDSMYVELKRSYRIDAYVPMGQNQTQITITAMNTTKFVYDLYAELSKEDVISQAVTQMDSKIMRPTLVV